MIPTERQIIRRSEIPLSTDNGEATRREIAFDNYDYLALMCCEIVTRELRALCALCFSANANWKNSNQNATEYSFM